MFMLASFRKVDALGVWYVRMVDAVQYSKSSLYETLKMLLVLFLCRRIDPFHQMLKSWESMALQQVLTGSSLMEKASPIRLGLGSGDSGL